MRTCSEVLEMAGNEGNREKTVVMCKCLGEKRKKLMGKRVTKHKFDKREEKRIEM